jgi:hypothetical protein
MELADMAAIVLSDEPSHITHDQQVLGVPSVVPPDDDPPWEIR